MNTASASRAEPAPRNLVWDAPVRVFHWLMVASFAVAWLSAESERWRLVHVTAGYTMAGLVAFRILWGLVGTRHARFSDFVRGPRAALRYLGSLLRGRPEHHAGHNPAGAVAILGLLALAALTAASGWASYEEIGGHWPEEVHEALANGMLLLVLLHVAGVLVGSWMEHDNLVGAMIHGRKAVPPPEGIGSARRGVAVLVLAGVLAFWWYQWQAAPLPGQAAAAASHADDED